MSSASAVFHWHEYDNDVAGFLLLPSNQLWVMFICLLSHFYNHFLYWTAATDHIASEFTIYRMLYIYMRYWGFCSLLPLKSILSISRSTFLDLWWVVYSCGILSAKPVSHLLWTHVVYPQRQHPVFISQGLCSYTKLTFPYATEFC